MSKHTTGYCAQYGIVPGSCLGDLVDHLREFHRIKIGTDYWVTLDAQDQYHDIISKAIWADDVLKHMQIILKEHQLSLRIKERPDKKDRPLQFNMNCLAYKQWQKTKTRNNAHLVGTKEQWAGYRETTSEPTRGQWNA